MLPGGQYAAGWVLYFLPRIRRIERILWWKEIDQKVSVGLGGVSPWAFRHRTLLKTSLGSSPKTQLPVLPAGPSKPTENKMAALGSTKRLLWSHNDYLRLVKAPPLSCSVLPSRQQYYIWTILAHLLRRCTRLLNVLPSRQQSGT